MSVAEFVAFASSVLAVALGAMCAAALAYIGCWWVVYALRAALRGELAEAAPYASGARPAGVRSVAYPSLYGLRVTERP